MKEKKGFRIYKDTKITIVGKVPDNVVGPHTDIQIDGGFKCVHGGYIPETSVDSNRAPYCSVCYPYVVKFTEAK
jgi:hypothetical protein